MVSYIIVCYRIVCMYVYACVYIINIYIYIYIYGRSPKNALRDLVTGVPRRVIDDPYLDPYPRRGVRVKAKGVWVIYGASRHPLKVHTATCCCGPRPRAAQPRQDGRPRRASTPRSSGVRPGLACRRPDGFGIHQRGVQWEGGAVNGGSMTLANSV